ncbi:MAG TPA: C4-type zinc ribbon domain-containing protein [Frankiaceae bacterium]|nr:C4-type zinc ribbon domain-containing protein [Frankiaceae bacterium]
MKAAPEAQLRLLELQGIDAALDRLAHRRRTLPELAEIEKAETRLDELRDLVVGAETELSDADREQRKVENDVDVVRTRMARDQQRLDTGAVSHAKELESLRHELDSLAKRQGDLEEVVLEHMERREEIEGRLSALTAERDTVTAAMEEAAARRDEAFASIDSEAAMRTEERSSVAAGLPEDLLALYEKIRADAGTGAAALHRAQCQGCHLTMPPTEMSRFRTAPEDEVLRCEECRRILVRTADSGL